MNCSDKPDTNADTLPRLDLVIDNSLVPRFFFLLQQGVMLRTRIGCSILVFLREEIGAGQGTIDKIQSIFLDGSPVDDLNAATIKDGSVLALSAAMPGLVGATLRRGGLLSSFRNTITYHEDSAHCASGEGFIQIKLFNLMMDELGPGLLKRGVYVRSSSLMTFLGEQSQDFWQRCICALLDGNAVATETLAGNARLSCHDRLFLSVSAPDRKA
ncbi:MAG: hypothetical protein ACLQF0_04655 [Dissulfurispiraceae bacterium]